MEKSAPVTSGPDSAGAQRAVKNRRRRGANGARAGANGAQPTALASHFDTISGEHAGASFKPLLIGVGIGAALVGTAVVLRSKSEKGVSPFHGPNAALAGALTKAALLAVARVVSGDTVRSVATRALLEVAEAWKA